MSYISFGDMENATPVDFDLRDMLKLDTKTVVWRVEIMQADGQWVPEPSRWSGKARQYASYNDAVAGAVSAWQRSDRPARPSAM